MGRKEPHRLTATGGPSLRTPASSRSDLTAAQAQGGPGRRGIEGFPEPERPDASSQQNQNKDWLFFRALPGREGSQSGRNLGVQGSKEELG